MGNGQDKCYEIKSKFRKKIKDSTENDLLESEEKTNYEYSNNHKINITIKKTRKQNKINKNPFLSDINIKKIQKQESMSTNGSNQLMNSFNIFSPHKRFQSPSMSSNNNKKINLINTYSPLRTFKKSKTKKNIYIKGHLIGQGRFGKVYSCLCTLNGDIATLKKYENISKDIMKLIIKNKEKIYNLDHPNIVKTILLYDENEQLNVVFDCNNLKNVQELIEEFGKFDENVIQKYSRQLLEGLKYLHERNIYHKNFKPRNILVDPDGNIKISDCYIDGIILGSAKNIYDNLLSASNNIEYYIPPFFIQNIFYFGENDSIKDSTKTFEDWQSFDLWYMGCFLIEITSGKKPWYHYNFKDNSDFFEFLKSTHLIPTIPKKMSLEFNELVQILLNPTLTNKKNIYDIIFNLNFFKKNVNEFEYQKNNNKSLLQSLKTSRIEKKIFEDSSYFADNSNIQLGQMLQNNKVKNILNNNNNASFSITNSMEDISFSNSCISNNNIFNSTISHHGKNEFKNFMDSKINKIKSIKTIKSDMTEVKELQIE